MSDLPDQRITLKVSHVFISVGFIMSLTSAAAWGWWSLKSDVADAQSIKKQVSRLECLMEQQNQFLIYGIKPTTTCQLPP